tara:strand:- start:873 stop:1445 length:573 start_codon:yes stop_codon:yes gene_type:complete
MIKILDNIITKKQQEEIKKFLYGNHFPWYYVHDITHHTNKQQSRPGHQHLFYQNGESNSHLSDKIHVISDAVNKKIKKKLSIFQARSFLQLPLNEKILNKSGKHKEDTPHIDLLDPHTVFLYYVNDCDGDTVLYNYKSKDKQYIPYYEEIKIIRKVKPKQGRVLIFDGMTWHSSTQPTKGPRCIINFDMV